MSTPTTCPSIRSIIEAALPACPNWCALPVGHFDPSEAFRGDAFERAHEGTGRIIKLDSGRSVHLAFAAEETVAADGRVTTEAPRLRLYDVDDDLTASDCRRLVAALGDVLAELGG